MDINTVRGLLTLLLLLVFLGIWAWAWSSKRKQRFEEAANLPFRDEHDRNPRRHADKGGMNKGNTTKGDSK